MVEIILTALSLNGEKAIRSYSEEKLSFKDKISMRANGITEERKFVSESPLVHISSIKNSPSGEEKVRKNWDILYTQLVLLYQKKMIDYGAKPTDYDLEVRL